MHLFSTIPSLLLAATLACQTASYATFGSSCGVGVCGGANTAGGPRWSNGNNNRFALPTVNTGPGAMLVFGFEIHTIAVNGPISTNAWLYLPDTVGDPLPTPAQTATMTIGPTLDWYGTMFPTPTIVQPNGKIFVSFAEANMDHPIMAGGTNTTHYYHGPSGPPWSGPFLSFAWKFRLLCAPLSPTLGASGVPRINTSFTLQLRNAAPVANTILIFGNSNTNWGAIPLPVALGFLGAGGCNLLVSVDVTVPGVADATGAVDVGVPVPNVPGLLGLRFHNQWLIRHAAQNPAGIVLTNGGTGVIGL